MVTLRQDTKGNFSARKRLPEDVREEYGEPTGNCFEAKFSAAASKGARLRRGVCFATGRQRSMHVSKPSAHSAPARALSLTPRQARALAGEWYEWFVARHPDKRHTREWEELRDRVQEGFRGSCWRCRMGAERP